MEKLLNSIPVLVVPFLTCLVIASLHCYMGLHVIRRGVIFVDLALAQCAALGAAVALFLAPILWPEMLEPPEQLILNMATEASMADELALEADDLILPSPPAPAETSTDLAYEERDHEEQVQGGSAHEEEHGGFTYSLSLLFALLGAVLLSFGRFKDECVPHEAIIGIIFVVCASMSVLILSKAPHGHDKMEAMLIGSILFTNWSQLTKMLLLYVVLGALHIVFRNKFITISKDVAEAEGAGMRVKLWDCLFFATFALMVTQSVGIAGVFVVFSYLIIPAACGAILARRFGAQLVIAWVVAATTTVAGLCVSAVFDTPTGSSLVSCFGAVLLICVLIRNRLPGSSRPDHA